MTGSGEKRWQVNERPDDLWLPSRRGLRHGRRRRRAGGTLAACGGSSPTSLGR